MKTSPKLLALLRGKIAADQLLKGELAQECEISAAYLAQQIHVDVPMRADILDKLLDRLKIREVAQRKGFI